MARIYNQLITYLLDERLLFSIQPRKIRIIIYYLDSRFKLEFFQVCLINNIWQLMDEKNYLRLNRILNIQHDTPEECPVNPNDIIHELNKSPNTIINEIIEFYGTIPYSGKYSLITIPSKHKPKSLLSVDKYIVQIDNKKIMTRGSNRLYAELFLRDFFKDHIMKNVDKSYFFQNKIKEAEFYYEILLFYKKLVSQIPY